jgi:mannosyl-3-phosphoglycerate phosphatase
MRTTGTDGGWLVVTDLDGTLLRHEDYDWSAAGPALDALARRGIPCVLASSKTRAEIEAWRVRLGNHDPFISENGGALHVPPGSTPHVPAGARPLHGYDVVVLGAGYEQLRAGLADLATALGVRLRGFGDMTPVEIGRLTGLAGEDLALASLREYDEPFVPERRLEPAEERRLVALAAARGLRVTRGGRFHHLTGPSSKGDAVRRLLEAWTRDGARPRLLCAGDGPNDLEFLALADRAVVVARPDGTHAPELREALPGAHFTRGIGPEGFREGVLAALAGAAQD